MPDKLRFAIVVSHPIQHFCPQYVSFAQHEAVVCKVFFASTLGFKKYIDPSFKQEISWGNLNLDRFDHAFLNGDEVLQPDKNLDAATLDNELTSFSPNVVVSYGYYQKIQKRTHKWALKNKVQLAYISDSEGRQHRSLVKRLLKYAWLRNYFSSISYFLSVGNANEAFYLSHGVRDERIIRMHFPIDILQYQDLFAQKQQLRGSIRLEYNIGKKDIVTAVVGKLVSWKNQDHIIDAMLLLEKQGIFLHLFVIGSGDEMDKWKSKAAALTRSQVHFTGFVSIDKLPAFYAAADFYTHPASIEPHSIAISEAIYMGCPVIISDRCGSYGDDDDVQEGKNGFVYPFGDIAALASRIKKLSSDGNLRGDMAHFSHNLGVKFQQRSHKGVLDELVKKGR